MEVDADPEELARLRSVFAAYDTKGSGRLERAEFGALCAELHVPEVEAEAVFLGLDTDRDGAITFPEFAHGFRGAFGRDSAEAQGAWDEAEPENLCPAWLDFHARLGDEAQLIPRKEQVSTLYQNINLVEPRLIQPYEHVIRNFLREIKLQSTEMENLAIAVKRLGGTSEVIDPEKRKAEEALSDLRRQYETEVGDLQVTIKKLKKENQKLKTELLEAQTNVAFLQSELDALKSDYADQSLNSERDLEIIREYTEDRNSLERQIEILQTANRKLHDSNDGLRSALENTYSKLNRSLKMNYEVDSLPESCFDSGLSTLRDCNECDSEVDYKHQRGYQSLHGTQENLGGDASDTDTDMVDNNFKATSQKAYKIVLAGDAAVGKSSFLMRLCKNEFQGNTSATLDSEVLPSLTLEKQMVSYCYMMLLVKKAFLTYGNGWIWLR
ncbi:RAS and EF hand domain containing [Cricetulus griseus]